MIKKLPLIVAVVVLVIAVYAVGTAVAAQVTVVVKGGPLSLTPSADQTLADAVLDGNDTSTTGSLGELQVKDARGTGAGWYVTAAATDFAEQSTANTIAAGGFTVPVAPVVTTIAGNGGVTSAAGTLSGAGFTLLNSSSPNGRGRYSATPDLLLQVPAQTYIGTYAATVTETLLSY
ncbi:MAG: WxL domain-containing protein [Actinomycetota bacterium]|nr:WxL domain-containing protein [Actinomycetota bacterium]